MEEESRKVLELLAGSPLILTRRREDLEDILEARGIHSLLEGTEYL